MNCGGDFSKTHRNSEKTTGYCEDLSHELCGHRTTIKHEYQERLPIVAAQQTKRLQVTSFTNVVI